MKPLIRNSLRAFLVLIVLMIAVLGTFLIRGVVAQKNARLWVEQQNGRVTFAYKYDRKTNTYDHSARPAAPAFLVDWFGIDCFASVDSVVLDNQTVIDIRPVSGLSDLRIMAIFIEIGDDLDFSPLADLRHLEELHLKYTEISAARFEKLRELLPDVRVTSDNHPLPNKATDG